MKLFGYYAWHSFKNQLKKLLKSWILIFILACALIGGLAGAFAAGLSEKAEEERLEEALPDENASPEDFEAEEEFQEPTLYERTGVTKNELTELIIGVALLVIFFFFIFNADKNGSKIFLPADVNLLFPSPMKPQSVLMFRVIAQLGVMVFASVYMIFQIPNLVLNAGLSIWAAVALMIAWGVTVVFGTLFQTLVYTVASTFPKVKANFRKFLYGALMLIAAGYVLMLVRGNEGYLKTAVRYLNGKAARFIPVWGWIKAFCMGAVEGKTAAVVLSLSALFLTVLLLIYLIWHFKADFYEDAMAKSEETAALQEAAQSQKPNSTAGVRKKKKDRSEKLLRDGMKRGAGANVFFHKAMYNRFRFARFGFLTKTMTVYMLAALATAAVVRFGSGSESVTPLIFVTAGLCFFRTLGNPLEQDTGMDFFIMIPENTWKKLFWSLAGGAADCFLDVLPALIIGTAALHGNMLTALLWLPFILSVDLYGTCVGTFIDLSVPVSAGKTVKQIVQIMFIYFGLLPDAAILAAGAVLGFLPLAALIAAALNLLLAFVFFCLCPGFLEPHGGKERIREVAFADVKQAKRVFSRIGFAVFTTLLIANVLQIAVLVPVMNRAPALLESGWTVWLLTFLPIYLAAVPAGYLMMRKLPAVKHAEPEKMNAGKFLVILAICVFMLYAGNFTGILITGLIRTVTGIEPENAVLDFALDQAVLPKILFMVVLAPLIEEFIFRRTLIDRMRPYGERLAVITSAAMFGLFHGNFSQMFYAFAVGLVFGYVYVRTGKLRYSVILHMTVNFFGSIVSAFLLEKINPDLLSSMDPANLNPEALSGLITPWTVSFGVYILFMLALAVTGLVLLIVNRRKISFSQAEQELPKKLRFKTVWLNAGMILFAAGCMAMVVLSVVQ